MMGSDCEKKMSASGTLDLGFWVSAHSALRSFPFLVLGTVWLLFLRVERDFL